MNSPRGPAGSDVRGERVLGEWCAVSAFVCLLVA